MNHITFQANQTAAAYVAGSLDETQAETFEIHLMGCTDCIDEVEVWRAIKHTMPKPAAVVRHPSRRRTGSDFSGWRFAASLVGTGTLAATLGWFGKGSMTPDLDSTQTVMLNLPSVSRGADDCTAAHLAPDTQTVIIRVPGVSGDSRIVVVDSQRHELRADQYVARIQPDGSHLVRISASVLSHQEIQLEAREKNGASNPMGCVSVAPTRSDYR
jgi:anti-sigma factor RsiW